MNNTARVTNNILTVLDPYIIGNDVGLIAVQNLVDVYGSLGMAAQELENAKAAGYLTYHESKGQVVFRLAQ